MFRPGLPVGAISGAGGSCIRSAGLGPAFASAIPWTLFPLTTQSGPSPRSSQQSHVTSRAIEVVAFPHRDLSVWKQPSNGSQVRVLGTGEANRHVAPPVETRSCWRCSYAQEGVLKARVASD